MEIYNLTIYKLKKISWIKFVYLIISTNILKFSVVKFTIKLKIQILVQIKFKLYIIYIYRGICDLISNIPYNTNCKPIWNTIVILAITIIKIIINIILSEIIYLFETKIHFLLPIISKNSVSKHLFCFPSL